MDSADDASRARAGLECSFPSRNKPGVALDDLEEAVALRRVALDLCPPGHPGRGVTLYNLACALFSRFEEQAAVDDLDEAIELHRAALQLCPSGHTNRLGVAADLEEAVALGLATLELRPLGHPHRGVTLYNLACDLFNRFKEQAAMDDLDEAIELHRAALQLHPSGHANRSSSLHSLALCLSSRYDSLGVVADLEEAATLRRLALGLRPPGHPHRGVTLYNLARDLFSRFKLQAAMCDLDEAIELHRAALQICPSAYASQPSLLHSLSFCLSNRYESLGIIADLEEAVALGRETLGLCPPGHPHRSVTLYNLACDLFSRFKQQATMHDLDKAIKLYHATLQLHPPGHTDRSSLFHSLALCLSDRYDSLGVAADLEKAITFGRAVLELRPPGHLHRGITLYTLACDLLSRFERQAATHDLDEAIEMLRATLHLHPPGHADRSSLLHQLSLCLSNRHDSLGVAADLEETMALGRAALDLCTPGHPHRGVTLYNLACDLFSRFEGHAAIHDLDEAIEMHRAALQLHPTDRSSSLNQLSLCLSNRYCSLGVAADLEEAIAFGHAALELCPLGHPHRGLILCNLAYYLFSRFEGQAAMHDLDEAIELYRAALQPHPCGRPGRALILLGLSACLSRRFNKQKMITDFEEVMTLRQMLLDLHPIGHRDRRKYLYYLAVPLWASFLRHFASLSSAEVQSLCQTVSRVHSVNHPVLATSFHTLSICLRNSVQQQGATADLVDAFRLATSILQLRLPSRFTIAPSFDGFTTPLFYQRALAMALVERSDEVAILGRVVDYLHVLANFLRDRFRNRRTIADLNEAIALHQRLIELRPAGHHARASSLHDLAICLEDRFRAKAARTDLEKAIELEQGAMKLLIPGDPGHDASLDSLTTYLRMKIGLRRGMITSGSSGVNQVDVRQVILNVAREILERAPTRLIYVRTGTLCDRNAQLSHFVDSEQHNRLLSSLTTRDSDTDFECIRTVISLYFQFVTLSHCWGDGEPSLRDIEGSSIYDAAQKPGLRKLEDFCLTALRREYLWAWSDTCCIDKESSVELQEAIGSMFTWYRKSNLTIVYLADVSEKDPLVSSKWFQRGWTLQELLAPRTILFYVQNWSLYKNLESSNHKMDATVLEELKSAAGITSQFLTDFHPGMDDARSRLQWASSRRTTRPEDIAYSLFGIFDVRLPILYGESAGDSLGRLLATIISQSGETSVLDWVGEASRFHSCFPAHITSYRTLPLSLVFGFDAEEHVLVTGQEATSIKALQELYDSLARSPLPRFINRRLTLPCLAHYATATQVERSASHVVYEIQASGLRPLEITLPHELDKVGMSLGALQLVRPWNSKLLGPSARPDLAVEQRLLLTLLQPFNALLLAELPHNEYRRIASSTVLVAQPVDSASILQSKVRTFTIV